MMLRLTDGSENCKCHRCIREKKMVSDWRGIKIPLNLAKMIVCGTCGNKRCPKASDHRLDCTNSNAPYQHGSVYE